MLHFYFFHTIKSIQSSFRLELTSLKEYPAKKGNAHCQCQNSISVIFTEKEKGETKKLARFSCLHCHICFIKCLNVFVLFCFSLWKVIRSVFLFFVILEQVNRRKFVMILSLKQPKRCCVLCFFLQITLNDLP